MTQQDFPDCFYYLISRLTLMVTAVLRKGFADAGAESIKPAYIGLLNALWQEDGLRSVELGKLAALEPSSMTGVLDRMERDGLIHRAADPDDRRAQRINLTEVGRDAQGPVLKVVDAVLSRVSSEVSEKDLRTTKATLKKLLLLAQKERG
jgi:DNA-binding MarR family transcriptional regulator